SFGVGISLDPRPGTRDHTQRAGLHDLVGRAPHLREVLLHGRPVDDGKRGLRGAHHVVHR
ncbi:MAG TPA: hypothetical protein VHM69_14850, partial [Rubrobacter sp.]|nr:hypothetical protein [Rubrobacter sp.]